MRAARRLAPSSPSCCLKHNSTSNVELHSCCCLIYKSSSLRRLSPCTQYTNILCLASYSSQHKRSQTSSKNETGQKDLIVKSHDFLLRSNIYVNLAHRRYSSSPTTIAHRHPPPLLIVTHHRCSDPRQHPPIPIVIARNPLYRFIPHTHTLTIGRDIYIWHC